MKLGTVSFFLIFSITLSLALLSFPISTNASADLIEQVCSRSNDQATCVASLESNPDSLNATLTQLGIIALRLASSNATDTSLYIKALLNDTTSMDPTVEQALRDCYDQYLDATEQLDDSIAAILANANKDVQTWVNVAIADIETCENGFKVHPGTEMVLSARNAMISQLCNNVLAIIELLTQT